MSVDPEYHLKHTNVSLPQLSHSSSQKSIAASEGYYSASEHNSSDSDDRKRFYQTPTTRTPTRSHEQLHTQNPAPVTSLRGVGIPRGQLQQPHPAHLQNRPISTIAEERRSMDTRRRSNVDSDSQPTTPGQDTTPYIRFAIDQLTRDEEVRGSRVYPEVRQYDEDYPVERIVPDSGLGYMAQEQQTQQRMAEHMSPNSNRHSRRHSIPRKPLSPQSVQFLSPAPAYESPARTRQPQYYNHLTPAQAQSEPLLHDDPRLQYPQASAFSVDKDVFVAHDLEHLPLRFVPAILRPVWLGLYVFLCLLMLAALIASAVLSLRSGGSGLWDYTRFGDGRYFVFEYLPTLLGMILFLWLIQIQVALQRIIPFLAMASDSFHRRSEAVFLELHPMQFLLPRLEHFRAGHPAVGTCYVIFWLFAWTIPLLAASFNVRYDPTSSAWRWVAVQGVIWTVVALYILLVIALVVVLVVLRQSTGLRWDPRSIADVVALLERSNVMAEYEGSEIFTKGEWDQLRNRADRIGYWSTSNRTNDIFYGIGEENGETRRFSVEEGRIREKFSDRTQPEHAHNDRTGDFHIRTDLRSPAIRLRFLPWYLKDGAVIGYIVVGIVLLIAFYAVSFVNSNVRLGFLPSVTARTNDAGFSTSNFVYSFVPALIGHFLFLTILSLDYSRRILQPYMALASKGGATAETSLLLDYPCRLPISATLSALMNRHFATALLSFVSLASISIPVLAGGCFWTQYYTTDDAVRVSADLPGYYALCFFLALYTIGLLALLPGRKRAALPHRSNTLAETISWVYASPLLGDRAFNRPQTKPELVTRLMGTAYADRSFAQSVLSLVRSDAANPALLEKESRRVGVPHRDSIGEPGAIRYGFGIFVGRDGLEHLGIDRIHRRERPTGLVIWEEQQARSKKRGRKSKSKGRSKSNKGSKHDRKHGDETEHMV
ncbi:hypothetical protein C7974DRAFT_229693 [Boeremia exigua]|uniref:uncharacterized protein n=1 Tax=Boeremia exigua TaxID=749465 RepID=UPI001E8D1D1B|nr:uncharacterized protein C7974DRAFT_229693 [Boeremia exigua]KAH6620269.1 hypothetical protein C7974DRAFT_229693 [Boeremia exigua]